MKISVVVPAYNEERILAASLASIREAAAAFERAGITTELIVCDNNSSDATAAIAAAAHAWRAARRSPWGPANHWPCASSW